MKFFSAFFFLFFAVGVFSQATLPEKKAAFSACKTDACKMAQSIAIAEYYLETDKIGQSQKWLDVSKKLLAKNPNANAQYLINSLQSELFYYMGLYQFGLYESQKSVKLGKELGDSLYVVNGYLIEGINLFEMNKWPLAEKALQRAKKYFPQGKQNGQRRFVINREYIYNNLAQLKIRINQQDSAFHYNEKAYFFAKKLHDFRCIANVERTFGELFLLQNKKDSAEYYFRKSVETSLKANIYDTALLGYGNLMECHLGEVPQIKHYFAKGENLIKTHNANQTFQKLFYEQSLRVFESVNDKMLLLPIQKKLLDIENSISLKGNVYVQNITNQYINSENKLLLSKINELDKQQNIKILQLTTALFFVLVLLLGLIIIRRKNKLQKLLLDQKNEISKDLHDDIGSELSSILINTNLLRNYENNDKQHILIDKISGTGSEISQRLNTFIWSLNTDNNHVQHFCEYVKQYAFKFLDGTEIQLYFSDMTEGVSTKILDGNSRKNLFFCIKEALNNAVKHSGATMVSVELSAIEKKALTIKIQDNGKGLSATDKQGNGLINLKKRMASLNGMLQLYSDKGLTVILVVNL